MTGYDDDRQWSDRFIPEIKKIVGPLLLEPASFDEDANRATDLIILKARDLRIACRMRRAGFDNQYPWDFTIRSDRPTGAETEITKIINGFGDWMFYGHAGPGDSVARWMVLDLSSWRAHLIRNRDKIKWIKKVNKDETKFFAFDALSFPPEPPIFIATSHKVQRPCLT